MPIDGHTIVFTYHPADLKYFSPLGLVFLIIPAILGVYSIYKTVPWLLWIILGIPLLITSLYLLIYGLVMKLKENKGLSLTVSPKGMITPSDRFIPIEEIDRCYIHFDVAKETGLIYKAIFTVLLKSGKKKKIRFTNYTVPFEWDMKSFPNKANDILGVTLFGDSEISIHETPPPDTGD